MRPAGPVRDACSSSLGVIRDKRVFVLSLFAALLFVEVRRTSARSVSDITSWNHLTPDTPEGNFLFFGGR